MCVPDVENNRTVALFYSTGRAPTAPTALTAPTAPDSADSANSADRGESGSTGPVVQNCRIVALFEKREERFHVKVLRTV